MDYIDNRQLDKLWMTLEKHNIQIEWIKAMLGVKVLQDITVRQYNFLIMIIYQVEMTYEKK